MRLNPPNNGYTIISTLLQRYFDAAEKDKERYMREYSAYQQTESYKQFMKLKYTSMTQKQKHIRSRK